MRPTCIATRSAAALLLSESSRWCFSVQAACSSWRTCTLADRSPLLPLQVHSMASHDSQMSPAAVWVQLLSVVSSPLA